MSEEPKPLHILQLDLQDIGPALEIVDLWTNEEVCIFTLVERLTFKEEILEQIAEHHMVVTSQEDEDDVWIVEFTAAGDPAPEPARTFTLYMFYNTDPFGEWWPGEIENINIFIHMEHVLDFDLFEELMEESESNLYGLDIYAPRRTADEFWEDAADFYDPIDEEGKDELYYLGSYHHYKLE